MDYVILKFINSWAGRWQGLDIAGIICAESLIFAIPLIIILVYFFSRKRAGIGLILVRIVLAAGLACLINYLIGFLWPRPRPFISHQEIYQLASFLASPKDPCFPSDHTAISFVMAFIILMDWPKFGMILLVPAILVGIGRIFVGVHWPSDILAGIVVAGLSIFLTKIFFKKLWKL